MGVAKRLRRDRPDVAKVATVDLLFRLGHLVPTLLELGMAATMAALFVFLVPRFIGVITRTLVDLAL